jgi:hypothetical protein
MLEWIYITKKINPNGRGSGNPKGAQWTVAPDTRQFQPLVDKIKEIASQTSSKFIIPDIWINYSPPGCINGKHTHMNVDMAGCYYITVPENSGTIQFETGEEIYPVSGDVLYWNADIPHWVNKNVSGSVRISVAFNIKFDN